MVAVGIVVVVDMPAATIPIATTYAAIRGIWVRQNMDWWKLHCVVGRRELRISRLLLVVGGVALVLLLFQLLFKALVMCVLVCMLRWWLVLVLELLLLILIRNLDNNILKVGTGNKLELFTMVCRRRHVRLVLWIRHVILLIVIVMVMH